jgi:hypothetical protein
MQVARLTARFQPCRENHTPIGEPWGCRGRDLHVPRSGVERGKSPWPNERSAIGPLQGLKAHFPHFSFQKGRRKNGAENHQSVGQERANFASEFSFSLCRQVWESAYKASSRNRWLGILTWRSKTRELRESEDES